MLPQPSVMNRPYTPESSECSPITSAPALAERKTLKETPTVRMNRLTAMRNSALRANRRSREERDAADTMMKPTFRARETVRACVSICRPASDYEMKKEKTP